MNLKNYTSNVAPEVTISHIEAYLAACGVTGISKQYKDKVPVAIYFHVDLPGAGNYTIRLPAKIEEVQSYLWQDYCANTSRPRKTKTDFADQAARTAWKIQHDWVQVQMSLIKLKQADFLEVFMGYLWDGKQTYYTLLKAGGFKQLTQGEQRA